MADLIDALRAISSKIEKSRDVVSTEEATKNAFVMPFIGALGYDVFDPTEVTPELIADVGVKKGEKIDYAILKDGKPIMLFECKHHATNLDSEHASQLYRYFACTECRVAVLTNGVEYRFFTDMDAPNKMDQKPFLVFKVTDISDSLILDIKKFSKSSFDIEELLSTANELKYMRTIKALFSEQLVSPSEEFVKFCAAGIGLSRMKNASTKEQFIILTRRAFEEFVTDKIQERLKHALGGTMPQVQAHNAVEFSESESQEGKDSKIVTTEEEIEGFYVVKAILRDIVDVKRIFHRDQQSYCGILLDDNNRKPVCRLHFNAKQKYVGVFGLDKVEERLPIDDVDGIYLHAERIRETVRSYGS